MVGFGSMGFGGWASFLLFVLNSEVLCSKFKPKILFNLVDYLFENSFNLSGKSLQLVSKKLLCNRPLLNRHPYQKDL